MHSEVTQGMGDDISVLGCTVEF